MSEAALARLRDGSRVWSEKLGKPLEDYIEVIRGYNGRLGF